jgi:hypothetical protein
VRRGPAWGPPGPEGRRRVRLGQDQPVAGRPARLAYRSDEGACSTTSGARRSASSAASHVPSRQQHCGQPTAAAGSSPGPCSQSADQDLQFWWEDAADFTFPPKLEIFTVVFHRAARDWANRWGDRARIAAANSCDRAEHRLNAWKVPILSVHCGACANSTHVGDGHACASTIGPPAPSANTVQPGMATADLRVNVGSATHHSQAPRQDPMPPTR